MLRRAPGGNLFLLLQASDGSNAPWLLGLWSHHSSLCLSGHVASPSSCEASSVPVDHKETCHRIWDPSGLSRINASSQGP